MRLRCHHAGRLALGAAAFFVTASLALAQNYNETGDAGSSVPGAQGTGAPGPLSSITGFLSSNGDADFYVINITNFAAFSATTVGGATLDTMLYLFDINGNPIYLNDDASGFTLQSTLPPGSPLGPQANGLYIIGISLTAVDPVNSSNQLLFAPPVFSTDVRGPNGGALGPVTGTFDSNPDVEFGNYIISLTGAATAFAVPEPSSVALFLAGGLGALALLRRRHRS